jgi:hypothetical protein
VHIVLLLTGLINKYPGVFEQCILAYDLGCKLKGKTSGVWWPGVLVPSRYHDLVKNFIELKDAEVILIYMDTPSQYDLYSFILVAFII